MSLLQEHNNSYGLHVCSSALVKEETSTYFSTFIPDHSGQRCLHLIFVFRSTDPLTSFSCSQSASLVSDRIIMLCYISQNSFNYFSLCPRFQDYPARLLHFKIIMNICLSLSYDFCRCHLHILTRTRIQFLVILEICP